MPGGTLAASTLEALRAATGGFCLLVAAIAALTATAPARAQVGIRPADERPALEPMGEAASPPELELQAVPDDEGPKPPPALAIEPRGFEVLGCTAFDARRLEETFAPWVGRAMASSDLLDAVDALRRRYHEAGYRTTEVRLPDQDLADGIVRIRVFEGRIDGIVIEGARHYRPSFVRARLERATATPLHVPTLIRQLEQLQEEPAIERIAAVLEEHSPGVHHLRVELRERTPLSLGLRFSNHRSPSIGSLGGTIDVGHASVLGWSDRLNVSGQFSEGLRDVRVAASVPVAGWATRLGMGYRSSRAKIVERSFADLDIAGEYQEVAVGLRQPFRLGTDWRLDLDLIAEWRRSSTTIFDRRVCFEANRADCRPTATIVRLRQELAWRRPTRALAARSTLSIGVDALGSTQKSDATERDGEFVSWLLQLQHAELLPRIERWPWLDGSQLLVRGDLQLASQPLLSFEQVAVGGARTVRGYRQNQVVRDNAAIVSLELRLPLWRSGFDRSIVELAPFVDYGGAWDVQRSRRSDESLTSLGFALRVAPSKRLRAELSWAHRFRNDLVEGDTLQSDGIYLEVSWHVP